MPETIDLEGESINYRVVEKAGIRNIYLRFVGSDLLITVPRRHPDISRLIAKHRNWILKQKVKQINRISLFANGSIMFRGQRLTARFVQSRRPGIEVAGDGITVKARSRELAEAHLARFIRDETERLLVPLTSSKAALLGKRVAIVRLRRSGRWGSCTTARAITYNAFISMLPQENMEYIVCHEVAHLKQMNHSKDFWAVVEQLCPAYKARRKELRTYNNAYREVFAEEKSSPFNLSQAWS